MPVFSQKAPVMFNQNRQRSIADLLLARGLAPTPIEHPMQGVAQLAQALSGTALKNKERDQRTEAFKAFRMGAATEPWRDPDIAKRESGELPKLDPTLPGAQAGGYAGGLERLSQLENNPEAVDLAMALTGRQIEAEMRARQAAADRQARLTDAKDLYSYQQKNKVQPLTSEQRNWQTAQNDPEFASFLEASGSDNTPKSVAEYQYWQSLPEDQQRQFLLLKRAAPTINLGGQQVTVDPRDPTQNIAERPVTLKPGEEPETKRLQAAETEAGKQAVQASGEAIKSLAGIKSTVALYDDAIAALDAGAQSGPVMSKLPSINAASIELDNIQKRLGLNVISETTFGALSEGELSLALSTAVPTGLKPPELRQWLVDRKSAQEKLVAYLEEAAIYLGTPGNTHAGWIALQKSRRPAPAASPPAASSPLTPEEQQELQQLERELGGR